MRIPDNTDDSSSTLSVSYDSNAPVRDGPLLTDISGGRGLDRTFSVSANGHSRIYNGNGTVIDSEPSATSNGSSSRSKLSGDYDDGRRKKNAIARVDLPGTRLFEDSYINREEFIRLIVQSLRDVGYIESADTLEAESGYRMEEPRVTQFRFSVLKGRWSDAEAYLTLMGVHDPESLQMARFLISQQKYLELLEEQNITEALSVLRAELAPLNRDVERLHTLSTFIMCSTADDLKRRANWDGANGKSRRELLSELHKFIPPQIMIPERRFTKLIEQSFTHQRTRCLYHNAPYSPESYSLYTDHHCTRDAFPYLTTNILSLHADEVWNIKWSHDGQYLASASRDKSAFIWKIGPETKPNVRECQIVHKLSDHPTAVGCLAWSLDNEYLLTSADHDIRMYNARSGKFLKGCPGHEETVSALEWLPDGSGFMSGGMDRKIIFWDADGQSETWLKTSVRITDLAIAPDLSRLVVVGLDVIPLASPKTGDAQASGSSPHPVVHRENRLIIYDYSKKTQEASIQLDGELTSVKISQDSRFALINHAPDEVQLWDLETARLARKFTGQRQGQVIIRSCFGGVDGNFIVSGSEDGKVYVWHRDTGVLLEILDGHGAGSVNTVAWNPLNEKMFASCSDDQTVRIWECPHVSLLEGGDQEAVLALEQNGKGKGKGKGRESSSWYGSSASSSSLVGASTEMIIPT